MEESQFPHLLPILIVAQWYFIVALICISLVTHDVELLFIGFFVTIFLLWRNVCSIFLPIFTWFIFLLMHFESSLKPLDTSPLSDTCLQLLCFVCGSPFLFQWCSLKSSSLHKIQLMIYFHDLCFLCPIQENFSMPKTFCSAPPCPNFQWDNCPLLKACSCLLYQGWEQVSL